jgi:peptidyl-prolyl cis-trans isomerase C
MKLNLHFLLILTLILSTGACREEDERQNRVSETTPNTSAAITEQGKAVSATNAETELANVNGRSISFNDFSRYLSYKNIPKENKARVAAVLEDYLQREAITDVIEQSDYLDIGTSQTAINEFKKQLLISRYFEQFLAEKVTPQAIKNYYTGHSKKYQSNKVQVAHILFRTHKKMTPNERKALQTKAHEVYSKLQNKESFETLARSYSEDKTSAKKGGDLGWISEKSITPGFTKKAFNLPVGQYSQPFETVFGYHIIKVLNAPVVTTRPFKAVQGDIRYQLRNEARQAEIKRLQAQVKITAKEFN